MPRWGETGVLQVPTFTLRDEQIGDLGRLLGMTAPNALSELKSKLEPIGARYRMYIQQDEKGPSRAERNAALKQVLVSPEELQRNLAQLDYATYGELQDKVWVHLLASGRRVGLLDQIARDDPDFVIDCATRLLAEGQKRRGPAGSRTLPIVISLLASVYEETTGLKFTHTPYEKGAYTSMPQSHAGRFVTTFLRMVDPDLTTIAPAIATQMANVVKARRGEG
jgi:hypothetical protein